MNRVIKFRGWNTKQKVMYSVEELAEDQLTLLTTGKFINVSGDKHSDSVIYDHIIPLQFTGLLDRNGKEIFEGDLVTWMINDSVNKGIITYVNDWGGYDMKNLHDEDYVCCDWLRGEYEVIGNIYETPVTS